MLDYEFGKFYRGKIALSHSTGATPGSIPGDNKSFIVQKGKEQSKRSLLRKKRQKLGGSPGLVVTEETHNQKVVSLNPSTGY